MARPSQDAIETFMSITGASEAVAVQSLKDHGGDLNEAVNAYFSEGDRTGSQLSAVPAQPQDDFMNIDEQISVGLGNSVNPLFSATRLNPFPLLDPNFGRSFFEGAGASDFSTRGPRVTHPREVRQIPIEFKDENIGSASTGGRPIIEEVTGSDSTAGPEIRGTVIIDDDDDDNSFAPRAPARRASRRVDINVDSDDDVSFARRPGLNISPVMDRPDYNNDIEEEMILAAIEASKREAERHASEQFDVSDFPTTVHPVSEQSPASDDVELAHAVSLSLKTAEQERALRQMGKQIGEKETSSSVDMEVDVAERMATENGRQAHLEERAGCLSQHASAGSLTPQEEAEDVDEQLLARRHSGVLFSGIADPAEFGTLERSPPSSPQRHVIGPHPQPNGGIFQSNEWGGISSEEHDEAVMLEAAMFGGVPEGAVYNYSYPSHQVPYGGSGRNAAAYPRAPRPPSPTVAAQRLLREQQDDEYLASLQADREKEIKAMQEAELRRSEEAAAREAALEKERRQEEEKQRLLHEEEELERKLAAKEASLPQEPSSDDENAVTLLVRMPDGSRRGRRFLKTDKLKLLFDFIDIGRAVKPGTYRLVRAYPRHAFTDGESELTLNELGLTSKQEALYIELI